MRAEDKSVLMVEMLVTGVAHDHPRHFFEMWEELPEWMAEEFLFFSTKNIVASKLMERLVAKVMTHKWFVDWAVRNARMFGVS